MTEIYKQGQQQLGYERAPVRNSQLRLTQIIFMSLDVGDNKLCFPFSKSH